MNLSKHIILDSDSIRHALMLMNGLSAAEMTLFAVDSNDSLKVTGTLTNGDVRRALLDGHTLDSPVSVAMNRHFRSIPDNVDDTVDNIRDIRNHGITMVPVVDIDGRVVDIADLTKQPSRLPLSAILMAGGVGERLRPLTITTPKPLLEIDGKAIIDYNVEALIQSGITDITVCTRYLADQIHRHFAKPIHDVRVKCVTESKAMGTIGAVSLINHTIPGNTLVMNSDLLTSVSFEDMYLKHRDSEAAVTIGVIPYQISVPYAILTTQNSLVTGIEEKPSYSYYANAGIYIFRNDILDAVPQNAVTDATDIIEQCINSGCRVVYHVINGTWIDIGTPTDFLHAQDLMRHHRNLSGN